jgi:hypothetical protein
MAMSPAVQALSSDFDAPLMEQSILLLVLQTHLLCPCVQHYITIRGRQLKQTGMHRHSFGLVKNVTEGQNLRGTFVSY